MARSPARPNTLPTRSKPGPRARAGLSEWNETGATVRRPRVMDRAELPIDTAELARFLVGKMLVRTLAEGVAGGRIVETEAYGVGDPAGHAYRGMTPRNRALFLERGHAYVYLAYGVSFMLNVSSERPGVGAGVLIRAIEPTLGVAIMERNRGVERVRDLARGPGRLCEALSIDRRLDGIDLCQAGPLWLGFDGQAPDEIGRSKRIGITRAPDSLLRFYVRGNLSVSGPRALNR
jgi:DNA-3-methyladenine glycosylase